MAALPPVAAAAVAAAGAARRQPDRDIGRGQPLRHLRAWGLVILDPLACGSERAVAARVMRDIAFWRARAIHRPRRRA